MDYYAANQMPQKQLRHRKKSNVSGIILGVVNLIFALGYFLHGMRILPRMGLNDALLYDILAGSIMLCMAVLAFLCVKGVPLLIGLTASLLLEPYHFGIQIFVGEWGKGVNIVRLYRSVFRNRIGWQIYIVMGATLLLIALTVIMMVRKKNGNPGTLFTAVALWVVFCILQAGYQIILLLQNLRVLRFMHVWYDPWATPASGLYIYRTVWPAILGIGQTFLMGYWIIFAGKREKNVYGNRGGMPVPAGDPNAAGIQNAPAGAAYQTPYNTQYTPQNISQNAPMQENNAYNAYPAYNSYNAPQYNRLSVTGGMKALCFIVPLAGLILYCRHIADSPQAARTCIHYAIGGVCFWVAVTIVLSMVPYLVAMSMLY